MDKADQAVILYNREALSLKGNSDISETDIRTAFERTDLQVFTNSTDFQQFIYSYPYQNDVLLLMSSGNYGGIDFSLIGQ